MAHGIAINGKRLDQVQMPLEPYSDHVVTYLCYPKSQLRFSLTGDTLQLAVPPLLGMELYRSGVLPQDPQMPVTVAIGGRPAGRFVVNNVRYPGGCGSSTSDHVLFTLERARKRKRPPGEPENPASDRTGVVPAHAVSDRPDA
jgi:hypothetical protein